MLIELSEFPGWCGEEELGVSPVPDQKNPSLKRLEVFEPWSTSLTRLKGQAKGREDEPIQLLPLEGGWAKCAEPKVPTRAMQGNSSGWAVIGHPYKLLPTFPL